MSFNRILVPIFFSFVIFDCVHSNTIPGSYVVSFRGRCSSRCQELAESTLKSSAETAACTVNPREFRVGRLNIRNVICPPGVTSDSVSSVLSSQARIPGISAIETDAVMRTQVTLNSRSSLRQSFPLLWNIDEVDGGSPRDEARTCTGSQAGEGVHIWVLDTGCQPRNGGECLGVFSDGASPCADLDGHGTHVSGSATHPEFGVAPNARLSCVKVLGDDGSGSTTGIIDAIQKVVSKKGQLNHDVINLSLSGRSAPLLDEAVKEAAKQGIFFSIAAGNNAKDACRASPAKATVGSSRVFSVQAHNIDGVMAGFSNYANRFRGRDKCTDLSAPGVGIRSSTPRGGVLSLDGTSMAAPHVAGAIATLLSDGKTVSLAKLTEKGFEVERPLRLRRAAPSTSLGLAC